MGALWHLHEDRFTRDSVIVRSRNCTLYGDMSRRVMGIVARFAPRMEIYSIDEAFLGPAALQDFEAYARTIRPQSRWGSHRRRRLPRSPTGSPRRAMACISL
jgi:nucleotidyltransferase/DNA polymerase involved in DNA repair